MLLAVWRDATESETARVKELFEAQQKDQSEVQLPVIRFREVGEVSDRIEREHDQVPGMTLREHKEKAPSLETDTLSIPAATRKRSRSRSARRATSEKKPRATPEETSALTHEQTAMVKDIVKQTVAELFPQAMVPHSAALPVAISGTATPNAAKYYFFLS